MLHLLLDLYGCDPSQLEDEAVLRAVLEEIPRRIDMQQIGPVSLRNIKTSVPSDDGYSGFVIIATSHVSLHAWAPYRMVNIDVFSCEPYEVATVVAYVCEVFRTQQLELQAIERATRSPRQGAHLHQQALSIAP